MQEGPVLAALSVPSTEARALGWSSATRPHDGSQGCAGIKGVWGRGCWCSCTRGSGFQGTWLLGGP